MKYSLLLGIALVVAIIGSFLGTRPDTDLPLPSQLAEVAATIPKTISPSAIPENWYPVVKVIDGDTISIMRKDEVVTLRLIGLDTPETVDPRRPVQCFGKAASDKAKQILSGTDVRLEFDPSQGTFDKYGRTLAYVYVPANSKQEGILFNEYMIAEGYGHEYTYNLPYKYQKEFKAAETRAREEKKGLWADPPAGGCAGNTKKSAAS